MRAMVPSERETWTPRGWASEEGFAEALPSPPTSACELSESRTLRSAPVRPKTTSRSLPWRIRRSEFRVRKERPRPRRKIDSSSEVLPDPLPPQIRLCLGCSCSSACSMQRRSSTVRSLRLKASHRRRGDWSRCPNPKGGGQPCTWHPLALRGMGFEPVARWRWERGRDAAPR
jgi:hypothetical protein